MRFTSQIVLLVVVTFNLTQLPVRAAQTADAPSVVISEVQAASAASLKDEFIELYNPTDSDIVLDGWKVAYSSTSASSQLQTVALTGIIRSHGFYVLSANGFVAEADAVFEAGLNVGGAYVQLFDNAEGIGQLVDTVGWNNSVVVAETAPAKGLVTGSSIERQPGRLIEDGGNATDTNDNSSDFVVRTVPQPQSTRSPLEVPVVVDPAPESNDDETVPGEGAAEETAPETPVYLPVAITELLIDPVAPLSDAADEFIELYNSNDTAVDVGGYTLKTGSNFHDYYVLPNYSIEAGGYLTLLAAETKLGLTNSGGAAQLLDPSGVVVSQTDTYEQAKPGQVWAKFADGWQWTLQQTPGQANVLVAPLVASASTAAVKKAAAKPKAAAKASSAKAKKAPAAKKPKAAKTPKTPKAPKAAFESRVAAANAGGSSWLLIAAIGLTIAYAIYEFRYDLQNYYYRARRYFRVGRSSRSGAARR